MNIRSTAQYYTTKYSPNYYEVQPSATRHTEVYHIQQRCQYKYNTLQKNNIEFVQIVADLNLHVYVRAQQKKRRRMMILVLNYRQRSN